MIFNEKSLIFYPCFCANWWVVSLHQNGPSNYTPDWSSKKLVATSLGLVFQMSQNPGNCNRTDHQRAWTTTTVQSFFSPVQFGLQSFCGPKTRLLNTINTDYKLLMKTLSVHLASHIHSLVHPDKTGFIPRRTIFDPIRLAQSMCAYTDFMEEDGTIVALDQEKAYNKIDHQYLLETLKKFNPPDKFIQTVHFLYENAKTAVIINSVVSTLFKVTRGVRQGDPLSCLLFNLAIEPLACILRNSP